MTICRHSCVASADSPDKAVEIARQLCAGLHAIHQTGVLHRDLKPANAIIDRRGKTRITDFDIAGLESELKDGAGFAGTPAYISPEQITGKEKCFPAGDAQC